MAELIPNPDPTPPLISSEDEPEDELEGEPDSELEDEESPSFYDVGPWHPAKGNIAMVNAGLQQEVTPVDLSAVAPAPPSPVAAPPCTGSIPPPPTRATLDLLPPGRPSHSSELVPPVARLASRIPAVAGDSANTHVDDLTGGGSEAVEMQTQ